MNNWRRIALIAGFVAFAAAVAFMIYWFFFRPFVAPPGVPTANVPPVTGLPTANVGAPGLPAANVGVTGLPGAAAASLVASGGLTLSQTVVPTVVSSPRISADGKNIYYYDRSLGQFMKLDPTSGVSSLLSTKTFPGVQDMTWSPTGEPKTIMEFPDGSKIFFDFETQVQATIPSHWQDFSWNQNGKEIVAKSLGVSENNRFLILASPDGSNARPIAELGRNESQVTVNYSPSNDIVAFWKTGSDQTMGTSEVIPVGKNRENIKGLTVPGLGFNGTWSPDGSKLLFSASSADSDWKPTLWIVNGRSQDIGTDRKQIGLLTWADKCAFASATLAYCAAPRELVTGAGFARESANDTTDDIYKVDVGTGQYRLVATLSDPAAVSKIIPSADGSTLYYTELKTGALKKIKLR